MNDDASTAGMGRLLEDRAKLHDDCRLIMSAIKKRWPIPDAMKEGLVNRIGRIITENPDDEVVIKAANVLRGMESSNQSDEHKVIDVRIQQRNVELDRIASELGIDQSLIVNAEGSSGIDNLPSEAVEPIANRTR
jgi:hypothetical protein